MPGPTTEVLNDDLKELKAEVHKIDVDLAKLGAEFGVFKWLIGLTLMATLSGIGLSIWWAATINTKAAATDARLERIEATIGRALGQATVKGNATQP
jgi:hypothetical protein